MVKKEGNGWGEPKHMGWEINTDKNEASPSISQNGNIYFLSDREDALGKDDIYFSIIENGKYSKPRNVGNMINTELYEDYPYIAPDESYIMFSGSDRKDGYGLGDIYLSYKADDGSWTNSINMGQIINSKADDRFPLVSPDGKYLFFISDRTGNSDIYWVDAKIIEELKPKENK